MHLLSPSTLFQEYNNTQSLLTITRLSSNSKNHPTNPRAKLNPLNKTSNQYIDYKNIARKLLTLVRGMNSMYLGEDI